MVSSTTISKAHRLPQLAVWLPFIHSAQSLLAAILQGRSMYSCELSIEVNKYTDIPEDHVYLHLLTQFQHTKEKLFIFSILVFLAWPYIFKCFLHFLLLYQSSPRFIDLYVKSHIFCKYLYFYVMLHVSTRVVATLVNWQPEWQGEFLCWYYF